MTRLLICLLFGGLLTAATTIVAPPSHAEGPVIAALRAADGHYVAGGASLTGADCSGLASVAQSLAMGIPVQRLGNTHSLLAGRWPHAIRGASPSDAFVMGVNASHMVISVQGVNVEATTSGRPFLIGPAASSPFEPRFVLFHVNPAVLI